MYIPKNSPLFKCPVCDKEFIVNNTAQWCYRKQWYNKIYICCSWTCYRKVEKKMLERKTRRGRKKKSDMKEGEGNS